MCEMTPVIRFLSVRELSDIMRIIGQYTKFNVLTLRMIAVQRWCGNFNVEAGESLC